MRATLKSLRQIWTTQDMTQRLAELAGQSVYYIVITLVELGFAGAVAITLLGSFIARISIAFLALINLVLCGIAIARNFDESRKRFLLELVPELLDELRSFEQKQGCL